MEPFPGKGNPANEEVAQLQRELARLREDNEYPKKGSGYLQQKPEVRYSFVNSLVGQFPIRSLCRVMEVSCSGYYSWRFRPASARSRRHDYLVVKIKEAYAKSHDTYGSPRIFYELQASCICGGLHQVARLMRQHGIRPKQKRRFQITTTAPKDGPVDPNVLDRQFTVTASNKCWAADMTYIWTTGGLGCTSQWL